MQFETTAVLERLSIRGRSSIVLAFLLLFCFARLTVSAASELLASAAAAASSWRFRFSFARLTVSGAAEF